MIGLIVIYIIENSLLYVNDIVEVSSVLLPILYADDTSFFLIGKNINVLIHNMNDELAKVLQWLNCNKLSSNIKKSQYIVFRSRTIQMK